MGDWSARLVRAFSRIRWRTAWQVVRRSVPLLALAAFFLVAVPGMRPDPRSGSYQALGEARDYLFDFVAWEAAALADKAVESAVGAYRYMDEEDRSRFVRDYLQLVDDIRQLEAEVRSIYTDPAVRDPAAASAGLRAERDALRVDQRARQALAEAIIQSQVAAVLVDYGFGLGGQLLPPAAIRFTQLPTILITSPRDHIERTGSYALEHGLTVDSQESLEAAVENELGVSALVVPIGGLAVWPSMLVETGNLPFVFEVTAHEWSHHYLAFFPLGFNYGSTPELYTMNETVASIVGQEIGWAVLDRYYPDLAPAPPDWTPAPQDELSPPAAPADPAAFDFRAEMRETRVAVDEMLAAGKIEEAEAYMEARRVMFVEQGYAIRRINQAYFAFYGSYADQPGATGADPVGPAVRELRYYSASLLDFVRTVRGMTTFEELQSAVEASRSEGIALES